MKQLLGIFFLAYCSQQFAVNYIHSPATKGDDSPRYNFVNTDAALSVLQPKYFAGGSSNPLVFTKKSFPVKLRASGYMRSDSTFASRFYDDGVLGPAFEGWPWQQMETIQGIDAYAQPQTSVSDINTRLGVHIQGNIYKDFDIEAFFNGAFVNFDVAPGVFAFYFAYILLKNSVNWLLIGSYWAPLGIQENLPHVVSYNWGAPFTAWSVFPQIMYGHAFGDFRLFLYAYNETYFGSFGPAINFLSAFTGESSSYQRQAVMPEYCVRAEYVSGETVVGMMADVKRLVPRSRAGSTAVLHEEIVNPTWSAYFMHANNTISTKAQVFFGTNGAASFLFGGYAVKTADPNDPAVSRTYANLRYASCWLSIESTTPFRCIQPGIFIGFAKELGSTSPLFLETLILENSFGQTTLFQQPICYSITTFYSNPVINGFGVPLRSLSSLLRIAPRIWFYFSDNVILGAELELSRAVYGYLDNHGRPSINQSSVPLLKPTLSVQCYF